MAPRPIRLGVNIDHVATIRNARGGTHPDPVRAARVAQAAGADGITAHLREDRRHISDNDIRRLRDEIELPLNLEMAATDEMLGIALKHLPHAACIVPEKRAERTTEGGLDVVGARDKLVRFVRKGEHVQAGQRILMFHDPDDIWIEANIRETDVGRIRVGMKADIRVDAYPGKLFEGKVFRIGQAATSQFALLPDPNPSGNFTKITQRLPVRILLGEKNPDLRPGMMVEVYIALRDN